jgi:hypothetical protein
MPVSGHCGGLGALVAPSLFAFLFFVSYFSYVAREGWVWKVV